VSRTIQAEAAVGDDGGAVDDHLGDAGRRVGGETVAADRPKAS